ncbi:MAG: hypothetical protein H6741_06735 [Alphaproteobacteria bacterium]|nr:hypothetical protein [Alphaproteobacteria bacterium]MCB9792408.1 hypothetical protein [Alphaproteobacteria bacterium]
MLDFPLPGLDFNHDHGLSTGPYSCMCNFGIAYEADYGHSGHLTICARVLPDRPKSEWPLVFWDEEEQDGQSFPAKDGAWLSGWLARFADWPRELAEHRDALVAAAEAGGDAQVKPILDAILAGERGPAALLGLLDPQSVMARTFQLASAQDLTLGRTPYHFQDDTAKAAALNAWAPLIAADPLFNAPAAYAASLGFNTERARAWLALNLKYDVGGSIGVADFTRAAARHLFEQAPDRDSAYWPIVQGYSENKYIGGDPWCAVGDDLLKQGQLLAAITAYENAILFERGWSEEFHVDALAGIQRAAEQLGSADFLEYLESMGED